MKPIAALLVALIAYVRIDILIWGRIFEADQLWQYAGTYHRGWFVMLYGFIALGVLLLDTWRARIFYAASLAVLCFNGTNDILYYWLDGRQLPQVLPWLDNHPLILFSPVTDERLLLNCFLWLALLAGFYALLRTHDKTIT